MQKRARHQEWAHLRVAGQPLLTGVALGRTPLLWVASRTSPCLVQVFQDGDLEAVLRFRSDPTFILLGERIGTRHVSSQSQEPGSRPGAASLLVITADGGIWLFEVPGSPLSSQETDGEQREPARATRAKSLEQPKGSSKNWQLFEDNDAYESNAQSGGMEKCRPDSMAEAHDTALSNLVWRNVEVTGSRSAFKSVKPKSVTSEALMAVLPTARVAAFVTSSSVVVVSQTGPPVILQAGLRHSQDPDQGFSEKSEQKCEPTCLLFASNQNCQTEEEGRGTALTEKLFTSISGGEGSPNTPRYMLLQGDNQGRVYVHATPNLGLSKISSRLLCDLGEPIVALLTASSCEDDQAEGLPGAGVLLIVGGFGTVIALSCLNQESSDSPFLPPNHTRRMQDIKLSVTDLDFHEWMIKAPVASVCMIGSQHLCYAAGPDVCCAEIFESASLATGLSQTQTCAQQLRHKLLHKTVPIADRVYGVAGNASTRKPFSGRPLVALTTRGRLISVELLNQPASNAFPDRRTNSRSSTSWGLSQARTRDKVKDLLQVVADIARQTDMVRNQCRAMNLAIHELGLSLHLAYELCKEKTGWPILCPTLSAFHGSAQPTIKASKGICCMLRVNQPPPLEVYPHQLCFGPASSSTEADDALCASKIPPLAQISVTLQNHSGYVLTPYWTLILKFESISPSCRPVAVYMSSVINSGQGLQVGADFSYDFEIKLPGSYLSPVLVSLFLCHVHEYHELLIENQSGRRTAGGNPGALTTGSGWRIPKAASDGREDVEEETVVTEESPMNKVPGAVCFLLTQYRVDILSLLRVPPGGLSWRSDSAPKRQYKMRPSSDLEQDTEGDPMFGLAGTFSIHGLKQQVTADAAEDLNPWRTFHLEDLLNQGAVSKVNAKLQQQDSNQITLMAPNKGMVTITIEKSEDGRKFESLSFQTTSESLCCLVREALLHRLLMCEREEKPDSTPDKDRKKLKMRGGKLVAEAEEVTEQPELDPKLANISRTKDLVEVLAHRAEAVTTEWRKIFDSNTAKSAETVAPAIAQTYEIVKDLVRAYKVHRMDPASNPL